MTPLRIVTLALVVTSCSFPAPDQPAAPNRIGRFIGLIANCGCSDVTRERMLAEYPRAVSGTYSPDDFRRMHGFVDLGAWETWDNQIVICREACGQTCMVNAIVQPLGGRLSGDGRSCPVTERDLHLTMGLSHSGGSANSFMR